MYKLFIVIILTIILAPSILLSQDMDFVFESDYYSTVSLGFGYDHNYYIIVPEKETIFKVLFGYQYSKEYWYGLGMDITSSPYLSLYFTDLKLSDVFYKIELIQNILGDHYTEEYYLDIEFEINTKIRFPMYPSDNSEFYQSDVIIGDDISLHNKFSLVLNFLYANDRFWTYNGFSFINELSFQAGSELDFRYWSYLSNYNKLEFWLPIFNKFLFIHFKGIIKIITDSFNDVVELAFYNYPILSNVRGVDEEYRDKILVSGSIEFISRFLNFEILYPMSLGLILFMDSGLVSDKFSTMASVNLKSSFGTYLEYKFMETWSKYLLITIHIGTAIEIITDDTEITDLIPKFYFNFIFGYTIS